MTPDRRDARPVTAVLVYGTVCLDRFVLPGQTDADATELPGGEAFNTATALAGWSIPVRLTGTAIGSDAEGEHLGRLLQSHPLAQGIDTSLLHHIPHAVTPVCTVRVDEQGERFMSGRGFREAVAPPLGPILTHLSPQILFCVDPNLGTAAIDATLAAARAGCPIISMDFAAVPEVLAVSNMAVTSHEWIARGGGAEAAEDAARRMVATGAQVAIVTEGAQGGTVCERDSGRCWRYSAFRPKPAIIDTTGAGDTFRAGLCYGLMEADRARLGGFDPIIRFAAAAAALHCTRLGGGTRVPRAEIQALLDQSKT